MLIKPYINAAWFHAQLYRLADILPENACPIRVGDKSANKIFYHPNGSPVEGVQVSAGYYRFTGEDCLEITHLAPRGTDRQLELITVLFLRKRKRINVFDPYETYNARKFLYQASYL